METCSRAVVDKINRDRFDVYTAAQWLAKLNREDERAGCRVMMATSAIIYTAPYARALVVPFGAFVRLSRSVAVPNARVLRPAVRAAHARTPDVLTALLFMDGTLRWRGAPSANDNRGAAA
jgi:hypothetical protein